MRCEEVVRNLSHASQFGIVFLGLFAGLLKGIAPPEDIVKFWAGLGAVVAGAAFLYVRLKARENATTGYWTRRFVICLFVGLVLAILYFALHQTLVVNYSGTPKIGGYTLTQNAQQYSDRYPGLTKEQLLLAFRGSADEVWTPDSLIVSRLLLGLTYILVVGLLALGLLFGAQGVSLIHTTPLTGTPTFKR